MNRELTIKEYAFVRLAQQLNHVYNEEGCTYGGEVNEHSNFRTMVEYIKLAEQECKEKTVEEIKGMIDEIGAMDGRDC